MTEKNEFNNQLELRKKSNIKLILSYQGTQFKGWQKTKLGASIEETLEDTLQKILQHPVALQAASRTDAGVHAEGQVVNFFTDTDLSLRQLHHSLNSCLSKEIVIQSIEEMPTNFHPTLDCIAKEYWYEICLSPIQIPFYRAISWHITYPLEIEKMKQAALLLLGTHDFSAFCNLRKLWTRNPCCTIESINIDLLPNSRLRIAIIADHFLYRMMRNLVGTLIYVGCGKLSLTAIPEILFQKKRVLAGVTAPAHGLRLKQIFYTRPFEN